MKGVEVFYIKSEYIHDTNKLTCLMVYYKAGLIFTLCFGFGTNLLTNQVFPDFSHADKTKTNTFVTEPPTLECAGFEWYISGDKNRNAIVTAVSYTHLDVYKRQLPVPPPSTPRRRTLHRPPRPIGRAAPGGRARRRGE